MGSATSDTSERRRGLVSDGAMIPRQAEQGGGDSLESLIPLLGRTHSHASPHAAIR